MYSLLPPGLTAEPSAWKRQNELISFDVQRAIFGSKDNAFGGDNSFLYAQLRGVTPEMFGITSPRKMNWTRRGSPAETDGSLRTWSEKKHCAHNLLLHLWVIWLKLDLQRWVLPGFGLWQWWGSSGWWRCFTAALCWQLILVRIDKFREPEPLQVFWSLAAACSNDFLLQFQPCFVKWLQQIFLCVGWRSPRCVHSVLSSSMQHIKNLFQNASKLLHRTLSAFSLSCSSWEAAPEQDPLKDGDFFFLILMLNLFGDSNYPSILKPTLSLTLSSTLTSLMVPLRSPLWFSPRCI